jgi:hypothetical protein
MNPSAALSEKRTTGQCDTGTDSAASFPCPLPVKPGEKQRITSELYTVLGEAGCPLALSVEDRLRFETFLANLSASFVIVPASQVDAHLGR